MKLTKSQLINIIKEEFQNVMKEARETYGIDPETLKLPVEDALKKIIPDMKAMNSAQLELLSMKVNLLLKQLDASLAKNEGIDEALPRSTELPVDAEAPMSPEEQRMDTLSGQYEDDMRHHLLVGIEVPDFDGSMMPLDFFLAKLGNYVVTGDVSEKQAGNIIRQIQYAMQVDPNDLGYVMDKEDFIDEKTLTKPETKEKERLVKGMKKDAGGFEERYPGRGQQVMHATATKLAKKRK